MKTLKIKKSVLTVSSFLLLFFFATTISAQEIEVKGIVKGKTETEIEVLNGANIYLKNAKVATISNKKGEFTFPKKIKIGEVLIFSYLGYKKKSIKIDTNATFLTVILNEDENQMLGALNSNKPYKSKPSKQQ